MTFSPKTVWLLAGLGATSAAGYCLLVSQPRQAATLSRLTALDSCLAAASRQRTRETRGTLATIQLAVARNRYMRQDVAVLRYAQRIQATTQALADTLRQRQQHWPTGSSPAALACLATQVGRFADSMAVYLPAAGTRAALLPTHHYPGWTGGLDLGSAPTPAAVAALTRLETTVRRIGNDALAMQAAKVGGCWGFDKIGAAAVPASNTVAPGSTYEAQLVLTSSSLSRRPTMQADGREVPVDPRSNQGLVAFRVPPARPGQPDTVRAQWQGTVRTSFNGVTDTAFTVTVPYLIVKPPQP